MEQECLPYEASTSRLGYQQTILIKLHTLSVWGGE
jgi:hypothetical protein